MSEHIWDIRITDTSLRDGSHHKRHQFTREEVGAIVAALDGAGVPVIEVTHGDGLGGSSFNYGFSKTPEQELIKVAAETAKEAKIAFLMLPGVGTKEDIKEAQNNGGSICRIATHCTEADVSIQHFGLARELASVYGANGLSTDQGLWLNGLQITAAWCDSYAAARSLIFNPEVSVAVCVMTKADVIEHGLPLDRWDNIVIENPDDVVLLVQAHSENIQPLKANREQPMA